MAKPTHYHGETYSSPWRNLLITMAKPTFQLQNPLILLAKNAPEDRRKKKEEEDVFWVCTRKTSRRREGNNLPSLRFRNSTVDDISNTSPPELETVPISSLGDGAVLRAGPVEHPSVCDGVGVQQLIVRQNLTQKDVATSGFGYQFLNIAKASVRWQRIQPVTQQRCCVEELKVLSSFGGATLRVLCWPQGMT
jgi:hypothetical protein